MCQYLDITNTDVNKMIEEIDTNNFGLISIDDWLDWVMRLPARNSALEVHNLEIITISNANSNSNLSKSAYSELEDLDNYEEEALNDDTHKSKYPIRKQLSIFSHCDDDFPSFDNESNSNISEFGRSKISGLKSIRGMTVNNFDLPSELMKKTEHETN